MSGTELSGITLHHNIYAMEIPDSLAAAAFASMHGDDNSGRLRGNRFA